ncbi:MAG TPA: DNA-processing protein DprA [Solirubrobacteraceae bacterium]|jgi:DNA processing protein|nr:DNA-processing protein DprA [Solirubrobacteraceae bacterium]
MSAGRRTRGLRAACTGCRRRSWLLSCLSGPLECCARDRARLLELLALEDRALIDAVAGRRKAELHARYGSFTARELPRDPHVEAICRHCCGYPQALDDRATAPPLEVAGGAARLAKLTAAPVVAILGSRAPSDYGVQMARSLARGLAASGVTVAASLTDGVAVAAHAGAMDAGGASVAVMGGGLAVSCPARRRSLYERVKHAGCAVSKLPLDCAGRRWGQLASERILAALSRMAVVVEADDTPEDLAAARIAVALGRTVAAIPGRVTSPLSRGTHALLMDGATLVRGPRDVLELLYTVGTAEQCEPPPAPVGAPTDTGLQPHLRAILERVGSGCDTPDKLARAGVEPSAAVLALSELEVIGLLARGDGGRYMPRNAL